MGVKVKELVKPGEYYIVVRFGGRKKVKFVGPKDEAESKAAEIETALKLYGADAWRLINGNGREESKAAPTLSMQSVGCARSRMVSSPQRMNVTARILRTTSFPNWAAASSMNSTKQPSRISSGKYDA
jgi:hypothetical protein